MEAKVQVLGADLLANEVVELDTLHVPRAKHRVQVGNIRESENA